MHEGTDVSHVGATTATWSEDAYVASWAAADGLSELLELPWKMASLLVGLEESPKLIIDIGSGPGTFLKRLMDVYPSARGVWVDASPAMEVQAREVLAPYAERVSYVVGDMTELGRMHLPHSVDVITNSRVAHHLSQPELQAFYAECYNLIAPGGWVVTLDHIRPDPRWDDRLRTLLPVFAGPNAGKPTHPHLHPYPTVADHVAAMEQAGFKDIDMPWRGFYTCLFMGSRP
jgi:SAM-dependent methyltransferase